MSLRYAVVNYIRVNVLTRTGFYRESPLKHGVSVGGFGFYAEICVKTARCGPQNRISEERFFPISSLHQSRIDEPIALPLRKQDVINRSRGL